MKSVVIEAMPKYAIKDPINLSLLQRQSDTTVPRLKQEPSNPPVDTVKLLPNFTESGAEFCRLAVAYDVTSILAREWAELADAVRLATSAQDDALPFLVSAQDALRARAEKSHINFAAITHRTPRKHKSNNNNNNNSNSGNNSVNSSRDGVRSISSSFDSSVSTPNVPTFTDTIPDTVNNTTPTTTATPTTTTVTADKHTNDTPADFWGEDDDDTQPPTSQQQLANTTLPSTPSPPPNQQQFTFHASFDSSNIPPSLLSTPQPTNPTKPNEPEPSSHPENLTQETPAGLYYFYQGNYFIHHFGVVELVFNQRI